MALWDDSAVLWDDAATPWDSAAAPPAPIPPPPGWTFIPRRKRHRALYWNCIAWLLRF